MHILVCDDDAAFAAQMDEYISEWFRAREIQVQSTVCTSGEQLLATRSWNATSWRFWM